MKLKYMIVLGVLLGTLSCDKKSKDIQPAPDPTPTNPTTETGSLKLEFENMMDTVNLVFGTKYRNANGDTFTVSKFNYFISNVVITKNDNTTYTEPNSYHLVKHSVAGSNLITITGVPNGSYKSIKFMLGVDSTRNVSGAQTGALDTGNDMYWSWSSGYIFLKFEGNSPQSGDAAKALTLHIGGYSGANKAQRNFSFDFSSTTANVTTSATPVIHMSVDASQLFKSPTTISFATRYNVMSAGSVAKGIADNYADMISFEHVHNF
jgi:hypothetical protein